MRKAGLYRSHTTNDWQAYWPYRSLCPPLWASVRTAQTEVPPRVVLWLPTYDLVQINWKCLARSWSETVSITDGFHKRNHVNEWSPLWVQSCLAWGSLFNYDLIQVGSGFSKKKQKTHSSPTEPNISPYMHMLNTIYLCVFMRGELKFSHSKMGVRVKSEEGRRGRSRTGWWKQKKLLFLCRKTLKCETRPPPQKKKKTIWRIKLNFTVTFPRRDDSSSPKKITYLVHDLSVSQTKASLIQSALSRSGGRPREEGRE